MFSPSSLVESLRQEQSSEESNVSINIPEISTSNISTKPVASKSKPKKSIITELDDFGQPVRSDTELEDDLTLAPFIPTSTFLGKKQNYYFGTQYNILGHPETGYYIDNTSNSGKVSISENSINISTGGSSTSSTSSVDISGNEKSKAIDKNGDSGLGLKKGFLNDVTLSKKVRIFQFRIEFIIEYEQFLFVLI